MAITKTGIIILILSIINTCVCFYILYKHTPKPTRNKLYTYITLILLLQLFVILMVILFLSHKNTLPNHCVIDSLPNVIIFHPDDDTNTQVKLDWINTQQGGTQQGGTKTGEWSNNRYSLLFMPGTYTVEFQVPYYVSIIGLGQTPNDVIFYGGPNVYDDVTYHDKLKNNGLDNFWRSCENCTIIPNNKDYGMTWAVSQASPLRKVYIKGNLTLFDLSSKGGAPPDQNPMTSGGFMSDCKIDGVLNCGSQQQFLFRNCEFNNQLVNGVWNMVYLGCNKAPDAVCIEDRGPPAGQNFKATNTIVEKTPQIVDKPTIFIKDGKYKILANNTSLYNTSGINWNIDTVILDLCDDCYVADPSSTASDINKYIDAGKHILFTPGIYNNLNGYIYVNKPNIILLGIGFPTLVATTSEYCILVGDVPNVTLAGILLQSGKNTDILCKWGSNKKDNGGYIYDLFARVGGPDMQNTNTRVMLEINSNKVICDNLWLWRADHGINDSMYIGWNKNTCDTAIIVNGDNVKIYGLAAEHTQKDITIWNGNNGYNVFYQSEFPYDVPSQDVYNDIVSYRVNGKNHFGYGLGAYSYFNINQPIAVENAFIVDSTSTINTVFTVFLAGPNSEGTIKSVINGIGEPVFFTSDNKNPPGCALTCISYVCNFPSL